MADIEIEGSDELIRAVSKFVIGLEGQLKNGLEKAAQNTAEDIKVIFKGGTSPGFKDRTGALRASIRGGLSDIQPIDDIEAFVGAGDNMIGSNGKKTKEYVEPIEFGEFSRAGSTSFLRSGVQRSKRQIAEIIKSQVNLEALI